MNIQNMPESCVEKDIGSNTNVSINIVSPPSSSKNPQCRDLIAIERKKTLSNSMISSDPKKHTTLGEFALKEIFKIITVKGYDKC